MPIPRPLCRLIDIRPFFYTGKWITGVLYLLTGALFVVGLLYNLWTLERTDQRNQRQRLNVAAR